MPWTLFAGILFILMGVSLAADAAGHAKSAAHFLPEGEGKKLAAYYRLGGLAFVVLGLVLAASPRVVAINRNFGWPLLAAAAWLTLAKRSEWAARKLPRGLGVEAPGEPWGPRLSRWAGWGLVLVLAAFGLVLLLSQRV